jgi:seryl-tRNA synthetase
MLDLNFVRDNLALVEDKLRQRGMNPTDVLKDFVAIDGERRQAITVAETLLARRNRASEEIAKLKKSGQDASAQIQETKELREQIAESEKKAAEQESRLREILTALPNLPQASRRNSILNQSRTGNSASNWECSTWSVPRNSPVRDSPCIGPWARV